MPSHTALKVYGISGQLIKTLMEGQQNGGTYTVIWDCKDNNGKRVTPGIYFYRLTAAEFTKTKKIVVVR